jgi:hypothetical protein
MNSAIKDLNVPQNMEQFEENQWYILEQEEAMLRELVAATATDGQQCDTNCRESINNFAVHKASTILSTILYSVNYLLENYKLNSEISPSDIIAGIVPHICKWRKSNIFTERNLKYLAFNLWRERRKDKKIINVDDDSLEKLTKPSAIYKYRDLVCITQMMDEIAKQFPPVTRNRFYKLWEVLKGTPEQELFKKFTGKNSFSTKVLLNHGIVETQGQAEYTMTQIRKATRAYLLENLIKIPEDNRGGDRKKKCITNEDVPEANEVTPEAHNPDSAP